MIAARLGKLEVKYSLADCLVGIPPIHESTSSVMVAYHLREGTGNLLVALLKSRLIHRLPCWRKLVTVQSPGNLAQS